MCELFQIGCSEQANKTHNFRKIICDVITLELYWLVFPQSIYDVVNVHNDVIILIRIVHLMNAS